MPKIILKHRLLYCIYALWKQMNVENHGKRPNVWAYLKILMLFLVKKLKVNEVWEAYKIVRKHRAQFM